jgi:hypothetical protein
VWDILKTTTLDRKLLVGGREDAEQKWTYFEMLIELRYKEIEVSLLLASLYARDVS